MANAAIVDLYNVSGGCKWLRTQKPLWLVETLRLENEKHFPGQRAARDEGGLSARQLKNAAAEPPNRYAARHVLPSATNRERAAGGGRSPPSVHD
ncbi:jg25176 [Pararge aegeria aegeria]|uniref:Jg25176 protein n=1 Tax=Pararge aegeria aegeria TaxID=348720 RepID=A0A8S4RUS3_9NEOP|nr:jg25176 [Pararge aegeria aegeria]